MKKLYHLLFLLFATVNTSYSQFFQVNALSGTLPYANTNVTVNYVGTTPVSYITPACLNVNCYAFGDQTNSGYSFSFSRPVTRIRLHAYSLQKLDTGRVWINGVKYFLTSANINTTIPSSVGCTSLISHAASSVGDLISSYTSSGCGSAAAFNGQVDIFPTTMIDSVRIIGGVNGCAAWGGYFYFASDTLPYIKQPLSILALCPGDTLKVPYIVSNRFNNGNTFSVQLSNAAGSFASPVTIGTRADTTGDTIVCVIPRTTAAGTGYRIRIAGSSPAGISFDNGTNITIKALAANRTVSSNSPLCQPDTVRLFAATTTGGVTYSWSGPNGFSSNLQNPKTGNSTASTHSGNYIVTMTTNLGCTTKDTTVVNVKPLPNKPIAGNNSPLCTGTTLSLADSATNTGTTYTWTGPNGFNSTSQNPSKGSVTTADNGSYIVTATLNGCSMKDTTVVTVFPTTPTPTAGNTGPYCTGSDIQLSASTVAGASYTWTGPNSFSASTQNPMITPANTSTAGVYTVYATANGCNSGTSTTNVSVVNGPTVNIYPSPNDTICGSPSGSATFTAVPAGSTGHGYQWYKNGVAITGATNSSYAATGILTGDEYSVKLIPGAGAPCTTPVNSNKIQMTVMPYIVPAVDIAVSPDSNVWSGVMLTFTATVANAGNSPKYQWKLNGTNVTGALSNTWGAANLSDKDKVSCEVTSSYICPQPQKVLSNVIGLRIKTGINNIAANNISIYPNPTQTTLTVEGVVKGTKIQLKDVLGRQVIHTTAAQTKTVLNTAQLPTGNYLLILTTESGEVMTEKVVKE